MLNENYNKGFYHVPRNNNTDPSPKNSTLPEKAFLKTSKLSALLLAAAVTACVIRNFSDTIPIPESAEPCLYAISDTAAKLSLLSAELALSPDLGKDILSADEKTKAPPSQQEAFREQEQLTLTYRSDIISVGCGRMPSSANEEIFAEDIFLPPPSANPSPSADHGEKDYTITPVTYGYYTGDSYIDLPSGGQLRNLTSLSESDISAQCSILPDFNISLNSDEPQVLIMHTHTTESFEPNPLARSTDSSENMAAVGAEMAAVFNAAGINTLHDTTVHDYPSYNGSYDRSRITVSDILEKYPSIKVVLDVHRDAIERENGDRIAPTAEIGGVSSAQVMIICGCDDGTMGMPDYMKNLSTAALFQQAMESKHPGLTRPILFDYRQYNQDLTHGSLLIEIGGHANTLEQAKNAGRFAAEGIAEALLSAAE